MPSSIKGAVASISDIARLAGVSASTVSRALAGSKMISVKTRNRINELAREHGFQLNQMARNLRLKRTNAIGALFLFDIDAGQLFSDSFASTMIGAIADEVTARGYDLLLTKALSSDEGSLDRFVNSGRVDGVIVIGEANQGAALRRVGAVYDPIVVWGQLDEDPTYCTVGTDYYEGGAIATRHLLKAGRRNIVFAGHTDFPQFAARFEGYLDAHREAGVQPGGHVPVPLFLEPAHAAMASYLETNAVPDGIVGATDVVAIATIRALGGRGLSVPGDVWITGYNDIPLAAQVTPPLTTVRQDVVKGAALMVDSLFRRIDGELCDSVVMTPELVIRASAP